MLSCTLPLTLNFLHFFLRGSGTAGTFFLFWTCSLCPAGQFPFPYCISPNFTPHTFTLSYFAASLPLFCCFINTYLSNCSTSYVTLYDISSSPYSSCWGHSCYSQMSFFLIKHLICLCWGLLFLLQSAFSSQHRSELTTPRAPTKKQNPKKQDEVFTP